jgi:uncharacterized protein (TIGR03435 family)
MRAVPYLSFVFLFSTAAFAQTSFEVADIQPSRHTLHPNMNGPFYGGGKYELRFATMADLIQAAYGVDADRVMGGPNWLEYDRFDIVAKVPAGSTVDSRKLMLQALLADRFKLVLRQDSKPMAAYRLTA